MEREWLIIPDYSNLSESLRLSEQYNVAFEYNDFWKPDVYMDDEEVAGRINAYKKLPRDRSKDTLHGVFLDIAASSQDVFLKEYSQKRIEQSLSIAEELGVKGVVFHTGLIAELQLPTYVSHWVDEQERMWRRLLAKYTSVQIYMENTFEKSPEALLQLKDRLQDEDRFMLCLDYGHACLTPTDVRKWVEKMSKCIGHIHLNDNDLKSDLHMAPGEGAIDFNEFKLLMEKHRIYVPILLEISDISKQRKALEYMKNL